MNTVIIGSDISKKTFDVRYQTEKGWQHKVFDNKKEGFRKFKEWIRKYKAEQYHLVMESTGRYGEELAEYFYEQGHLVSVLNPAQIRFYSKSFLSRAKTDKIDSRVIATFALKHEIRLWQPLSAEKKKLKTYQRCLEGFKADRAKTSNRLEQEKDPQIREIVENYRKFIDQKIKEVEECLKKLAQSNEEIKKNKELLESIPGIGATTAYGLLAELPELESFNHGKQLSAYAGLNPSIRRSGTSIRGRGSLSKMGSKNLRKLLYFPAITAMRYNPVLKQFSEKLKNKGKITMVIIGAVMHKLLHIVFGVLKKQQRFRTFLIETK